MRFGNALATFECAVLAALSLFLCFHVSSVGAAEPRLIESSFSAELAGRGFTGVSRCSETDCLEYNPSFLASENEQVRLSAGFGARFNEQLFDTIDSWQKTKDLIGSDRYHEILIKTWNFLSRQTAKVDLDLGLRVRGFAFSYSPASLGAILFAHDPVLPYGELYTYSVHSFKLGYGNELAWHPASLRSLSWGAALKLSSGRTQKFVFNQFSGNYDQSQASEEQWGRARLGASATLASRREIVLSAAVSGIPVYGKIPENLPNADYFDVQPGLAVELGRWWWGHAELHYELARLTRNENFWLKNRVGVETTFGKLKAAVGASDSLPTYGLTLVLPVCRFSFASYGVEYSNLARNVTDRIYWFALEI